MSEYKFRLIPGDMVHLSLAKERFLKGMQNEQWAERHPDHFVIIHDHEALAFTETLSQTRFQLDEAERRRIHAERTFIFYIGGPSARGAGDKDEHVRDRIERLRETVRDKHPSEAVVEIDASIAEEEWPSILRELIRLDERELFGAVKELGLAIDQDALWIAEKVFHDTEKAFPDGLPAPADQVAA